MILFRFVLVAALAFTFAFTFASVARAQPAPATPSTTDNATLAKEHFAAGTRAYNLGEFSLALTEYKTAYKLNPLPAFLFNIGQCHYALGEYERAIFFYEGFIRESPSSEHRARVEGFIAEARRRQEERAATTTPVTGPATTTPVTTTPATTTPATTTPTTTTTPVSEPAPTTPTSEPDEGWFWPTMVGAAGVVVVATTAAIVFAVVSAEDAGTLAPIDARKGAQ